MDPLKAASLASVCCSSKPHVDAFTRLARDGVDVTILSNTLEATDVPVVHAGYAKWRTRLLKAGISSLRCASQRAEGVERNITALGSTGAGRRLGASRQDFRVDGAGIFVGSFNFDPRSANLNTELGFVRREPGARAAEWTNPSPTSCRTAPTD